MRIKDFKNALLVAMLRHQRKIGLNKRFEPRDAANEQGLIYVPGQIRLCVTEFERRDLIRASFTLGGGEDGGLGCSLTAAGIEEAEDLEQTVPELTRSNRFVRLADHENEINQLRDRVKELENLIRENLENSFSDKEGCLAEVMALDMLLAQPQISVPLVEKIFSETISYLAQRFAEQTIGKVAATAIALATALFGFSVAR